MDAYIKREHVLQALTYVGTAEPTDIMPLTLATARKAIMRLPTAELEQLEAVERLQEEIEVYKAELESEHLSRMDNIRELTIELESMRGAANSYKMHYENLAREIFEEIEKLIFGYMFAVMPPNTMAINYGEFSELKKKYMGG